MSTWPPRPTYEYGAPAPQRRPGDRRTDMQTNRMMLRLRKGEDAVNVEGRRLLVGLATRKEIAPGTTVTIEVHPQLPGYPVSLLCDEATAMCWDLDDWRVGKNSQFLCTGPVPLVVLAEIAAEDAPPCSARRVALPDLNQIELGGEGAREYFDLDFCPVGLPTSVCVTNMADKPMRFRGALVFLACENPRAGQ